MGYFQVVFGSICLVPFWKKVFEQPNLFGLSGWPSAPELRRRFGGEAKVEGIVGWQNMKPQATVQAVHCCSLAWRIRSTDSFKVQILMELARLWPNAEPQTLDKRRVISKRPLVQSRTGTEGLACCARVLEVLVVESQPTESIPQFQHWLM